MLGDLAQHFDAFGAAAGALLGSLSAFGLGIAQAKDTTAVRSGTARYWQLNTRSCLSGSVSKVVASRAFIRLNVQSDLSPTIHKIAKFFQ